MIARRTRVLTWIFELLAKNLGEKKMDARNFVTKNKIFCSEISFGARTSALLSL